MKQLLIISGKGGTGKTTVASAFIHLTAADAFADCDVDAPNLHLVLPLTGEPQDADYYGMDKAHIDPEQCINCGCCKEHCRFDAISMIDEHSEVNLYRCEGCGVCELVCPVDAVTMQKDVTGQLKLYKAHYLFSTAQLRMGYGVSGKLVAAVKKQLLDEAVGFEKGKSGQGLGIDPIDLAIIDGSPGIGCPVIASLSGVDLALIVAEPSVSGISDLERITATAAIFDVPMAVCVNKADLDPERTEQIKAFCGEQRIAFVGMIPFDQTVTEAVNSQKSIVEYQSPAAAAVREVWRNIMELLGINY
ncbi:MAG: 4Fe-4S binding protein [Firmicutes bacterium]|jgi:MinD superfamily P-loop ATPase|nr:ATP-binding protein [Bacillota bacterium]NLL89163.1 4Fe-4S binding protein [Bacillota bacterium]HKM17796.1 ATP-binding protein [Limnochordia bacterium]